MRTSLIVGAILVVVIGVAVAVSYFVASSSTERGDALVSQLGHGEKSFIVSAKLDSGVSDSGLAELAEKHPQLEVISITQCPQITDEGLRQIGRLRSLRELALQGRPGFTEAGLVHLASCTKLETLNVLGLAISISGARALAGMPSLKTVVLRETMVTREALSFLQRERPDLKLELWE